MGLQEAAKNIRRMRAWNRDSRSPDGMINGGWRLVREGGWVKIFSVYWQHDKLLPFVGSRIWIDSNCYYNTECIAYRSRHSHFLCRLENSRSKEDR